MQNSDSVDTLLFKPGADDMNRSEDNDRGANHAEFWKFVLVRRIAAMMSQLGC
jgi:hypothetical protein